MKNTIRYILYARKSSEGEDRQVESIQNQVEVLRKLAKRLNLKVVAELNDSKSAKTPYQRNGFDTMLRMINDGEADAILCWQINRLSRNPAESGILQQLLQDEKIKAIQTNDKRYLPDDNAVIFSVEASIGNQFIRDLRKNVKRGIEHKLRHGGLSGVAPEGYSNVSKGKERSIEPNPERFHLIKRTFELFLTGDYTVPQLRNLVNDDWGYTTVKRGQRGGGPISRAAFYGILRNPRYAGKIPNPFDDTGPFNANFPAMITPEQYDEVQKLLGKHGRPRLCASKQFALKGFIRCGECGCMITAQTKKKKLANGNTNYHTYYHCTGKRPCSQKRAIREQDLFDQLNVLLDSYELTPKLYEWGMAALEDIAKQEINERDGVQEMQTVSIKQVQTELDNLLKLATKGFITPEQFKQESDPLKAKLKTIQSEQVKTADRVQNWYEVVGKTLETLTDVNEKFAKGELNDKKQILMAIGQNPILLNGKLEITPNEWLFPVKNEVVLMKAKLRKVRTMPYKIQKASEEAIKSEWYTREDSNL